jgi:hypothetical protein
LAKQAIGSLWLGSMDLRREREARRRGSGRREEAEGRVAE